MIETDDLVRIGTGGVSVFRVLELDGDHALIETVQDCPGRYPWPARIIDLVPAQKD